MHKILTYCAVVSVGTACCSVGLHLHYIPFTICCYSFRVPRAVEFVQCVVFAILLYSIAVTISKNIPAILLLSNNLPMLQGLNGIS